MSKYKNVYKYKSIRNGKVETGFRGKVTHIGNIWTSKIFQNERLCAIEVDKHLISIGKEPINILKKKL